MECFYIACVGNSFNWKTHHENHILDIYNYEFRLTQNQIVLNIGYHKQNRKKQFISNT